jgi:hypothetical protein
MGRINIVKMAILSKIIHKSNAIFKEIEKSMLRFMWNHKKKA